MLKVGADLIGISPLSYSGPIKSVKDTGENHDAFEERTWRERMHVDKNGEVYIPANALKNMLTGVALFLSETVRGKGKATYTKHFEAGILVVDSMPLGIKAKDVPCERLFVPSDGKKGGSKRVFKNFPIIMDWQTHCEFFALDPILIADPGKIKEYLEHAGKFIGFLRFRPRNGGFYGRFSVKNFKTEKVR